MHPSIGGGVSTDFKSSNRIKISRLVQILLHFYWFGAPPPPLGGGGGWSWYLRGYGWCGDLLDDVEMMGTTRERRGDDRDDVGTTGTTWGGDHGDNRGDHGDHSHGDHMGTFWELWGQCGDDGDDTGTTWGRRGDHGDNMGWRPRRQQRRPRRPQPWGPHGDLLGAMGMTGTTWGWRGQRGDHADNEITKNAITFERIEIIEFRLKIWDPWTLSHTCRVQLMCRWGGVLSQIAFLSKKCSGDSRKQNFPVFALDPIRPYLDWALRGFLTSWPIYDPLKLQLKWKQSAKFD